MSRVEEAQDLLNMIADSSKQLKPESLIRITITPLLSDIAMSLAVIADSLTGGKENET